MSWSSPKKKECIFYNFYFVQRKFLLTFIFNLNARCIEYLAQLIKNQT